MNRAILLIALSGVFLVLPLYTQAEEKVFRIGIIGLDTSHVVAFTRLINDPEKNYGCKVVVGYPGGSPDIPDSANQVDKFTKQLREEFGVEIVDSIEELCRKVDGVMLESVDGRPHLEQVKPVIAAKKPVFIDKPMAGNLADVIEIFRLAKENNVPCWSSSSLRFSPAISGMRNNKEVGEVLGCDAFSACSLEEHHPDLYWYGVHGIEILFTIMGPGCESVRRVQTQDYEFVIGLWKDGTRIVSIIMLSGATYRGKMFIDATYEGDLMAAAGVSYHVGREANKVYNENWNGTQVGVLHHGHHFKEPVDPYVTPGDPSSGLLPRISDQPPGKKGEGDHRIQAYCFRMCLTDHPENRLPFPKPQGYDPKQYELLLRIFQTGWNEVFHKFDLVPNRKTDTNNHGPFSTDNIGMNYDYPEADYERRRGIVREHEVYQKGLMYFLANDPRVPEDIRMRMKRWGLAKDEFLDNGNWPHQLYIREARRMVRQYVMTEHDVLGKREVPSPVGMGSYTMDSHNVQRYVKPDGHVQNEGDIGVPIPKPYRIAFGSLLPKKSECQNLLVPVCVSSSHIAFGSIRMEPVFMILGQSAATAAAHAIDEHCAVQNISYDRLRARLLKDGQRL